MATTVQGQTTMEMGLNGLSELTPASLAEDGVCCVILQKPHGSPQRSCHPCRYSEDNWTTSRFATQGPIQLIVHLTFHGQWHLFQLPCQPLYSGGFACLGSPPKICKLQRCRCLSLRWQVIQFVLKSLHPRLRNTCTSATNVFQAVS